MEQEQDHKTQDIVQLTDPPDGGQKGSEEEEAAAETRVEREKEGVNEAKSPENEPDLTYKNGGEIAKAGVLGFFIGLAVIVPGVSGSTVAIIFKLYHKLLYALGNIVRKFKRCVKFLIPIAIGLVIGFVLGFLAIQRLIDISPFTVIGLFAGLMLGAFPAVLDEVKGEKKSPLRLALFAVGLLIPVAIALISV